MHNYHNLKIYHQAIDLAEKAYKLTILLTRSEQFGLTSQIRRASTGIASNIAEG
ncbi:MAG: four helix bundle protein, partial [Bacteroidota bacterium]